MKFLKRLFCRHKNVSKKEIIELDPNTGLPKLWGYVGCKGAIQFKLFSSECPDCGKKWKGWELV